MEAVPYWSLIREVLQTGPADGYDIVNHIKPHNLWETLYLASRSSPYAVSWREAFGRERISHENPRSVLLVAVRSLVDKCNASNCHDDYDSIVLLCKFAANCCAENKAARFAAINAGVLKPLLQLLRQGFDPNILIPAIFNVCSEYEDTQKPILTDLIIDHQKITLYDVEVRLSRSDDSDGSIYNGLFALLHQNVIGNITADILDYLTELLDMASKAMMVAQSGYIPTRDDSVEHALALLLSPDNGQSLASRSQLCHNAVCRAVLAVTTSQEAQLFVATRGLILDVAFLSQPTHQDEEHAMLCDDADARSDDSMKAHVEAVQEHQKSSLLRLVYAVAALPQCEEHMSYGTARQALDIISRLTDPFHETVAYIMLHTFINTEQRAHLLINEGLFQPLLQTLRTQNDLQVIHPASSLLVKLSAMWSLKARLLDQGALQVVQRLLLASNLGFEIPATAVLAIEFLIKGHPKHIKQLLQPSQATALDDIFTLFGKGNEAICLSIGRLFIEIFTTLAVSRSESSDNEGIGIEWFIGVCPQEKLIEILIFTAKSASPGDRFDSRIWYALGLLVMSKEGIRVVKAVCENPDVAQNMHSIELAGGRLGENINFVKAHIKELQLNRFNDSSETLLESMQQMSLGSIQRS